MRMSRIMTLVVSVVLMAWVSTAQDPTGTTPLWWFSFDNDAVVNKGSGGGFSAGVGEFDVSQCIPSPHGRAIVLRASSPVNTPYAAFVNKPASGTVFTVTLRARLGTTLNGVLMSLRRIGGSGQDNLLLRQGTKAGEIALALGASYAPLLTLQMPNQTDYNFYALRVGTDSIELYTNGCFAASVQGSANLLGAFQFGSRYGGLISPEVRGNGAVDDFRLYATSLTPKQILQLNEWMKESPVVFDAPKNISGDSDVRSDGRVVWAYTESNVGGIVNGVPFTAGNSASALGSGLAMEFNVVSNTVFGQDGSSVSGNYTNLLRGAALKAGTAPVVLSFQNLIPNHRYLAQFWVNDSRAGAGFRTNWISSGSTVYPLACNVGGLAGGLGQTITATFTASSAWQQFSMYGNVAVQLNAVQLRDLTPYAIWDGTAGTGWGVTGENWIGFDAGTNIWGGTGESMVAVFTNGRSATIVQDVFVKDLLAQAPTVLQGSGLLSIGNVLSVDSGFLLWMGAGLGGSAPVVKTGLGTVQLAGNPILPTRWQIQEGTLSVGSGTLLSNGLVYRLDASDASAIQKNQDGEVFQWSASEGTSVGLAFTNSVANSAKAPVFSSAAMNGRGGIVFGMRSAPSALVATASTGNRSVFIAHVPQRPVSWMRLWGDSVNNIGVQNKSQNATDYAFNGGADFSQSGAFYLNGTRQMTEPAAWSESSQQVIVSVRGARADFVPAIGQYAIPLNQGYYRGEIGEILVYDRVLSDSERTSVERYLQEKWFGAGSGVVPSISSDSVVDVSYGAWFTFNCPQRIADLQGRGGCRMDGDLTIENTGDSVFYGMLLGSGGLVKKGPGSLSLGGIHGFTGSVKIEEGSVTLSSGRELDSALVYAFDVSAAGSIVTNTFGEVTAWNVSSGSQRFALGARAGYALPVLTTNYFGGRPSVRFAKDKVATRLTNGVSVVAKTYFVVYTMDDDWPSFSHMFGDDVENSGIEVAEPAPAALPSWRKDAFSNLIYVDGNQIATPARLTVNQPQLVTVVSGRDTVKCSLGSYGPSTQDGYFFKGAVAEIRAYNRELTGDERRRVEGELVLKWGLSETYVSGKPTLPVTDIVLSGGTLNLNGWTQTVKSLRGTGTVSNGTIVVLDGGSCTAEGNLSIPSAEGLTVSVSASTDGQRIVLSGDATGTTLAVAGADRMAVGSRIFITCNGTPAFTFDRSGCWSVKTTAEGFEITRIGGTVILLR